jgi:hypothetical protein
LDITAPVHAKPAFETVRWALPFYGTVGAIIAI